MAVFGHFWANYGCFSHPSHTNLMPLRTQGPLGCRMNVLNFRKTVWTTFEKFEIFIERSGEKKTKTTQNFFRLLKFVKTFIASIFYGFSWCIGYFLASKSFHSKKQFGRKKIPLFSGRLVFVNSRFDVCWWLVSLHLDVPVWLFISLPTIDFLNRKSR